MDQPCSVKYQSKYVDQKNYLHQSIFSMYVHGNFSVTTWCYSTQNWKPLPSASSTQILSSEASLWLFFWGCTEIPSSYGNVTMGLGEATRLWSGWFEHSPFQKAETSNLPKLVNLTNETHSDSFHFTRTAIENKKSWTNTTCIQKRKNYPGEKHVKALLLPSTFGLPRWYQKHSKTFKRTWILWILESLLLFERNYLFQSLRLAPHLFTLISIPDFVVTFGLNQHPLPADFFLFQDIAAAQHRKECRQTVC